MRTDNESLNSIFSLIIAVALMIALVFLSILTIDMQETWVMITELENMIKHQQNEIRRLKLLIINIKAKSV
jgi:cell division protein FtsL|tara:strand:+ start:289 stop:501 length:213 start_codon:yes stop_codon:yes gene_type:complete